jgi:preprotein translocase subunit SecE
MALELYKPEEATRIRGLIAILLGALVVFGVYSLHEFLATGFWQEDLLGQGPGAEFPLSPRVIVCTLLTAASAFGIYVLNNHPRVVDFFIDTEKEMQNVSWPPRHEVISSSLIVIVTVVVMAVYLGLVDYILVTAKDRLPWDSLWDKIFGAGGA